ncbi:PqiC family protein [Mailhella massiliensis]|uniref:PqiC family protein n=1 Tax=Mailhella massiliensis TaxID=1903261 RepID=UPI00097D583B|nr:PqiC family protein [Mailhella massiliensis]
MKALLLTLALATALTGCSFPAQLRSSPSVRYYVLSSPLPQSSASEAASIGVLPVTLPGYLTRQQIVLRDTDGVSITINEYDRWAESLSQGISRVLCDTLAMKGVPALPLRTGAKVTDKLMLDVRRLDGPLGGNVVFDVVWRLQRDGAVLRSGHMVKSRPAGDDLESLVNAQSQLVQDLAAEIAARLR